MAMELILSYDYVIGYNEVLCNAKRQEMLSFSNRNYPKNFSLA